MDFKLVLSSKSPRRKQLLEDAGYRFEVRVQQTDESWPELLPVEEVAEHIAMQKALAGRNTLASNEVLLAADTVVILDDMILGKPSSSEEAEKMLRGYSGRSHKVVTGVVLMHNTDHISASATTTVDFDELSEADIRFYIQHFKPFDKAGAYAIQEWIGLHKISSITGCYYNVVGLPVNLVSRMLREFAKISPIS